MCMFVFAVVYDQIGIMAFEGGVQTDDIPGILVRLSSRARFMRSYFWSLLRSFWQ